MGEGINHTPGPTRVQGRLSGRWVGILFYTVLSFLDGADHRAATQGGASTFSRFFRRCGTQVPPNIIFTNPSQNPCFFR